MGRICRTCVTRAIVSCSRDGANRTSAVESWAHAQKDPRPPRRESRRAWVFKIGRRRRTLPPGGPGSTIRAAGFHFRVRDGIGWIPRAIATGHKGRVWVSGVVFWRLASCARAYPRVSLLWLSMDRPLVVRPVKPHGPLVRLGCSACAPCTCRLSTWWSPTALQGSRAPGKIHLWRGFPLRCFQRLSRPDIATRHCRWHDNRYTRGRSVPVLSY